jgi:hypothetical protein
MLMIQCETGQSKYPESALAQEAGELIALATHNWQSQSPGVRPRDEVLISGSRRLILEGIPPLLQSDVLPHFGGSCIKGVSHRTYE